MPAGLSRRSCSSRSSPTPRSTSGAGGSRAREGGARAAGGGRLALWLTGVALLFLALSRPSTGSASNSRPAHGPAPAARGPGADLPHARADQAHPAARDAAIHWVERAAGPFGHPAFGVIAYVGAMWLWHVPTLYEAALDHSVRPCARAPDFAAAGPSTGGTCSRRSARGCGSAGSAGALHGLDEAARRLPRDPARLLPRASSTTSTTRRGRAGGSPPSTTSTWPGW